MIQLKTMLLILLFPFLTNPPIADLGSCQPNLLQINTGKKMLSIDYSCGRDQFEAKYLKLKKGTELKIYKNNKQVLHLRQSSTNSQPQLVLGSRARNFGSKDFLDLSKDIQRLLDRQASDLHITPLNWNPDTGDLPPPNGIIRNPPVRILGWTLDFTGLGARPNTCTHTCSCDNGKSVQITCDCKDRPACDSDSYEKCETDEAGNKTNCKTIHFCAGSCN